MARVLIAVTTDAARAFGGGLGAVIGLELVARHPHRVSTLVAFEPSLPTLLDVDAVPAAYRADAHAVGDYIMDSGRAACVARPRSCRRPAVRHAAPGRTAPRRCWHAAWAGR